MVYLGPRGPLKNLCCGTDGEHQPDCWTRDPQKLPWYPGWWAAFRSSSPFPTDRCWARTEPHFPSRGRCELTVHEAYVDHAVHRGFDVRRWSTRWTA